jgi:hypothetical protein
MFYDTFVLSWNVLWFLEHKTWFTLKKKRISEALFNPLTVKEQNNKKKRSALEPKKGFWCEDKWRLFKGKHMKVFIFSSDKVHLI